MGEEWSVTRKFGACAERSGQCSGSWGLSNRIDTLKDEAQGGNEIEGRGGIA